MKTSIVRAFIAVTAIALLSVDVPTLAAQSTSGQAVLEVLRRIETLEGRLQRIEASLNDAPEPSAVVGNTEDLEHSLMDLQEYVGGLEGAVADIQRGQDEVGELERQMASLDEQLAQLRDDVSDEAEAESGELTALEAELRALVASLRDIAEEAASVETTEPEGPQLSFAGRVHTQYASTSAEAPIASAFSMRRARLTASVTINDFVSGRVQPDFGSGKISLKDAYFRFKFASGQRFTVGQFKRPFDLFELTSSTQTLVIERAGKIEGAGACGGIGGICSFSRFSEKLGFADRDIGVMLDGKLGSGNWAYSAAVTNGTGANKAEENDAKSFGGRLMYSGIPNLEVALNAGWHDYANAVDSTRTHAPAWGVDAEWGSFSGGWHAQVGYLTGSNWKALDEAGVPATFRTAQGILSFKHPVRGVQGVEALEPLGRVSWGAADIAMPVSGDWFYTAGVAIHFIGRNKLALNLESWTPPTGDREWSFKVQSYLHF